MGFYISEWLTFLGHTSALAAIPLVLGGILLTFGGWRIWKAAVVLTFGLIGAVVGVLIGETPHNEMLYGAAGFLLLAAASFPPVYYAVAVLGGIIGAALSAYLAESIGLGGTAMWLIASVGLIVTTALSFINLRQVIIIVTAFEGAVLLLSAVVAVLSKTPGLFNFFRSMAFESSIFVPFLLMVPTVIGVFLQAADANQKSSGVARD